MAIKRAAEEAREEMAGLLVWQQEQNRIDAELRRQAASERQRVRQRPVGRAAQPAAAQPGTGIHSSAPVRGGSKVTLIRFAIERCLPSH